VVSARISQESSKLAGATFGMPGHNKQIEATMTDGPQGDGWWQASDLKWYPPEQRPDYMAVLPPPPAADAPQQQPESPATTRQLIARDKLGVLTKIGQGGQGVVYRAPNVKTK
jgi:hypothetical protein